MRIRLDGSLQPGVSAKDVILNIIAQLGIGGGRGYVVEYTGDVVRDLSIEGRLTLCNMTIEFGARTGLVAPDQKTLGWLSGRPWAPSGPAWNAALERWSTLSTDPDATFDREVAIDCSTLEPQITWGTDPSQTIAVTGRVPANSSDAIARALTYMGLEAGQALQGLPVHRVFIGSCTNARVEDLQTAIPIVQGRHVAAGVQALIVPGSSAVKRDAEALGLDKIFRAAGFEWHESGCSMCAGANGEAAGPGQRVLATSNRNFENRQGPGVRTHLVSPAMAAAGAIAGKIVDVRTLMNGR
jgi:3-isopropylmalate/(R)-2-methylmalate dehydratase large subunit